MTQTCWKKPWKHRTLPASAALASSIKTLKTLKIYGIAWLFLKGGRGEQKLSASAFGRFFPRIFLAGVDVDASLEQCRLHEHVQIYFISANLFSFLSASTCKEIEVAEEIKEASPAFVAMASVAPHDGSKRAATTPAIASLD